MVAFHLATFHLMTFRVATSMQQLEKVTISQAIKISHNGRKKDLFLLDTSFQNHLFLLDKISRIHFAFHNGQNLGEKISGERTRIMVELLFW